MCVQKFLRADSYSMGDYFKTSTDHLMAEIKRIEMKLRLRSISFGENGKHPNDSFQGMYIDRSEIEEILDNDRPQESDNTVQIPKQEEHLQFFKEYMKKYDLVFATTAKGTHYRNIKRLAIFPDDINLPASKSSLKVAILFGKESRGLTN